MFFVGGVGDAVDSRRNISMCVVLEDRCVNVTVRYRSLGQDRQINLSQKMVIEQHGLQRERSLRCTSCICLKKSLAGWMIIIAK